MLASEAMEYIMGGAGIIFDPDMVRTFIKYVVPFPIGTMVELSNGNMGVVVENYSDSCMRPKLKIVGTSEKMKFINLRNDPNLKT